MNCTSWHYWVCTVCWRSELQWSNEISQYHTQCEFQLTQLIFDRQVYVSTTFVFNQMFGFCILAMHIRIIVVVRRGKWTISVVVYDGSPTATVEVVMEAGWSAWKHEWELTSTLMYYNEIEQKLNCMNSIKTVTVICNIYTNTSLIRALSDTGYINDGIYKWCLNLNQIIP